MDLATENKQIQNEIRFRTCFVVLLIFQQPLLHKANQTPSSHGIDSKLISSRAAGQELSNEV